MKKILFDVLSVAFLFFSTLTFCALLYSNHIWGDVYIEQILLNITEGISEIGQNMTRQYIYFAFFPALLLTCILFYKINKNRYMWLFSAVMLIYCVLKIGLIGFLLNQHTYSDLFEKEYIFPAETEFKFPAHKKNLIVIYLESMEQSYDGHEKNQPSLIPNIQNFEQQNLHFPNFHQIKRQDYTIAAMVSSMCATPYKVEKITKGTDFQTFLPEAVCLPQILKQNGYATYFIKGASLSFARTGLFLSSHGFEETEGRSEIHKKEHINLKKNLGTSWGYNDRTLYSLVKQKLLKISNNHQPFFFSFITLDTHEPDTYLDKSCTQKYGDKKDVIVCADSMLAEFILWLEEQDFAKDTVVAVLGDHIATGLNPIDRRLRDRKIVNFFITDNQPSTLNLNRAWTTLDIAPTLLDLLGVEFADKKFGLGRSLLSNTPTLYENMGLKLETELQKASKVYEQFNTAPEILPTYPSFGQMNTFVTDLKEIQKYALTSEIAVGKIYLDALSFTLPQTTSSELIFDVEFFNMFIRSKKREINVYVNKKLLATWHLDTDMPQPFKKRLLIPADLYPDHRLLIEFQSADNGSTLVTTGIGIQSFQISAK